MLIFMSCFIIFLSGMLAGIYVYKIYEKKENKYVYSNYVHVDRIADCFKDVNWSQYKFTVNGSMTFTDNHGNENFISAKEVLAAIDKLNKEIEDSR